MPSDDERFVAERLTAAANGRTPSPNPDAVVRRGQRLRRRQRLAQGGLAMGVVAGLALGATQVDLARAERRDVVVAGPSSSSPPAAGATTRSGPLFDDSAVSCAFPYSEQTLAQRSLAFDGTIVSMANGQAEFAVNTWYAGAQGDRFRVRFPRSTDPNAPFGVGTRLLVGGESDDGVSGRPVVWSCGFTRYWSQADAAVWDRAFGQSLGSPTALSSAWCVTDPAVVEAARKWRSTPRAQEATRQVGLVLDDRYGPELKSNPKSRLEHGVLGTAGDAARDTLVVVVDPTVVEIGALQRELDSKREASKKPAPVIVRAGCRSSADLARANRVIQAREWHPQAKSISFGTSFDVYAARVDVLMPLGEVADALEAELGDLVRITEGTARRN